MEALVILFGELLIAFLMPVIALVGAVLGAVVEAVALLLGGVFGAWAEARSARRKKRGVPETQARATPRKPLIPRKLVHWVAGSLTVVGVVGLVASALFFEPMLRFVMDRATARTGATVSFERAEGNLLAGRVALWGVKMTRDGGKRVGFDLSAERAEADVVLWSLLSGQPEIELAMAEGVRGSVALPAQKDKKDANERKKAKLRYHIAALRLRDVALEIAPAGLPSYPLVIETAEVAPLRSSLALFDLLFRSNMRAEIAGQSVAVATRELTANGRETLWRMESIEADKLRQILPRAPLTWLQNGRVDVAVQDRWSLADDWIEMDWRVSMDGIGVKVPAEAGAAEKLLGGALAKLVKAKGGDAEFRYKLELDERDIELLRSRDLDAFWDVVLSGFLKDGAKDGARPKVVDKSIEDKPGKVKGAIDKVKDLLKREASEE